MKLHLKTHAFPINLHSKTRAFPINLRVGVAVVSASESRCLFFYHFSLFFGQTVKVIDQPANFFICSSDSCGQFGAGGFILSEVVRRRLVL